MRESSAGGLCKHEDMRTQRGQPFNAETPLAKLGCSFFTPTELFYVRCHGEVPEIDPATYSLGLDGLVGRPTRFSLRQLREDFPKTEMTATLYCAGNRRKEMMEVSDMPGKVPWGAGAAGNARWGGVALRDVLHEVGVGDEARHAAFVGLDRDEESGTRTYFGGSIPVQKALAEDVLLAYEMNGETLPYEHGFPLRVLAGGYIGARSVKWLSSVTLQETPSDNHYQAREYKVFPPHLTAETADYSGGRMLGQIPLNAVICAPGDGETVSGDELTVRGYAIVGGDRSVRRVEVSTDGGSTWTEANFEDEAQPAAWRFWRATVGLDPGRSRIVARATDSASGVQPRHAAEVWNFQGYANNAWHGVEVLRNA